MRRLLPTLVIMTLFLAPLLTNWFVPTSDAGSATFVVSDVSEFIRGPTVNMVTNNSATIFWRTDTLTNSSVFYGENASLLESKTDSSLVTNHLVNLTSLKIDTKYYYKVVSNGVESEMYFFYTAPPDGEEFKLIIAGDNRPDGGLHPQQPEAFYEIADLIIEEEPHLVILLGDFVYRVIENNADNLAAWAVVTNITDTIGHYAPVIGVVGNHDTGVSSGEYQIEYFLDAFLNTGENKTFFSFDYAGVHFTILDSEEEGLEGHITGTQFDWLEQDLTGNQDRMKFVFAHRPLYSTTHIGSSLDLDAEEQTALQNLFETTNVSVFAAGHDHSYSRLAVNGVLHLISGGLGAPMYNSPWSAAIYHFILIDASANEIDFTVIRNDGEVYSEYDLPFTGPIEIVDRIIANTSSKPLGTIPVIFFSKIPTIKYYSWDGAANTTEITGLPGPEGEHILKVYAENDEGVWSKATFVFTTIVPETGSTDTGPAESLDIALILGIAGIVGVVVVVGLIVKIKKS